MKNVITMKINADLYVKDVPGQLVSSLEPISSVDGNIVGVVHNREQSINGRIVVNVTFDVDPDQVDNLKKIWRSRDVIVAKLDSVVETFTMDYMLVGDLSASYIEELFGEASTEISFESIDIGYSSKTAKDTRTAMISVKVQKDDDLKKLDRFLSSACKKAGFVYIRGVRQ
ncbi:MAG: homoserine dehydrogenase [Candidatus Methanomethylophilaceae archaeon]